MSDPLYPTGRLLSFDNIKDSINKYYDTGKQRGLSTGWLGGIDEYFTLKKGQLNIVVGIPSSGKSEWMDQLILHTIALHEWHWTVFSPENWPLSNHFQKFAEKWTGKPMFFDAGQGRLSKEDLDQTVKDLSPFITFVDPPEDNISVKPIVDLLSKSIQENTTDAFILDPWNECEHSRPPAMSETEYIGQALTSLRNFARRNNIAIFIVAHPTKLVKRDDGKYPVPTPYDIAGSANWRNKADSVLSVWRDYGNDNNEVELHIQKVRNKNLGKLGQVNFYWERTNGLFFTSQMDRQQNAGKGIRNLIA